MPKGELFAILSALAWAFGVIAFTRCVPSRLRCRSLWMASRTRSARSPRSWAAIRRAT